MTPQEANKQVEKFRKSVIGALTSLSLEVNALKAAVSEQNVTPDRLDRLREFANEKREEVRSRFEQAIGPLKIS